MKEDDVTLSTIMEMKIEVAKQIKMRWRWSVQ